MINDKVDFTCLKPEKTQADMMAFFEQARKYQPYSVCVFPMWARLAGDMLGDTDIKLCTVIGFPFGVDSTGAKILEAECIVDNVDEIDMVMNYADLKSGFYEAVLYDIRKIRKVCKHKVLKVIIETCYLTRDEMLSAINICLAAKVDFIKTSTGYGTAGANVDDIKFIKMVVGDACKIKASGGIKTLEFAQQLIDAGADRIGSSSQL